MLYDMSKKQNWVITATENAGLLRDDFLAKFDVAVFLNPTGDAVCDEGQAAFEKWMNSGKGLVGIHAAADCEYDWNYYDQLLGAHFKTHPPSQKATVVFENFDQWWDGLGSVISRNHSREVANLGIFTLQRVHDPEPKGLGLGSLKLNIG